MSSPLIQRLLESGYATMVDQSNFDQTLQQNHHTLLFFAGDVRRFPESNDLAVILPELAKAFSGQFQIGVVDSTAEEALQKEYGFSHWPALVLLRGSDYLGTITKLQAWADYCAGIQRLLQSEPTKPPSQPSSQTAYLEVIQS